MIARFVVCTSGSTVADAMILDIARRDARTTCEGLLFGHMFVSIVGSADASWRGAKNEGPPADDVRLFPADLRWAKHTLSNTREYMQCLQPDSLVLVQWSNCKGMVMRRWIRTMALT